MIPAVMLSDALWLVTIVILMHLNERNERVMGWLMVAYCYVSVELLFHVPMELAAAALMRVVS